MFEAALKRKWLNLSMPLQLNIVFGDTVLDAFRFIRKQISIVSTPDMGRYYRFVLIPEEQPPWICLTFTVAVLTGAAVHIRIKHQEVKVFSP